MKLYWPIDNIGTAFGIQISQRFGQHGMDYSQFGLIGHNGIDISAPLDTPILAPHDGFIIEQVAKDTGFGLRISQRVNDDGKNYLLLYGHMHKLAKPLNMAWSWNNQSYPVKRGDVIGYVDSTGFSTGNHLHFGVYEYTSTGNKLNSNNGYGGAIDPMPFLGEPFMTNAGIVKRLNEYGVYMPATSADGLITLMRNIGIQPPLKPDPNNPMKQILDFDKVDQLLIGRITL